MRTPISVLPRTYREAIAHAVREHRPSAGEVLPAGPGHLDPETTRGRARLEDAATAGAGAAETLPFERLAQRSLRQLGADLGGLAASESPFPGRSARNPPGKAGERR